MGSGSANKTANHLDEFALIDRFFNNCADCHGSWKSQGIGDDCAFIDIGSSRVAVTTDMMALGTHFLDDADPYYVGRKALAVNLSDLAAAGASPRAFFLSIGLPKVDSRWLESFSRGLLEIAKEYDCPLLGGDTTKTPKVGNMYGKTTISITALGELPPKMGLTRSGSKVGDEIWVSGTIGDAYAALSAIRGEFSVSDSDLVFFKSRMDNPTPRVELGGRLLGIATSCCDVSDGLITDLGHILKRSNVSAELYWDSFPKSEEMSRLPEDRQIKSVLSGGDDYELLFTVPKAHSNTVKGLSAALGLRLTCVGKIVEPNLPLSICDRFGQEMIAEPGFNHFA